MRSRITLFTALLAFALVLVLTGCKKEEDFYSVIVVTEPVSQSTEEAKQETEAYVPEAVTEPSVSVAVTEPLPEPEYKYVAFTFDDGPHSVLTKKFVDTLAEYDGRGTFFIIGDRVNDITAESLKYAVEHGNEIAIHAFTHKYIFDSCDENTYANEIKYTRNTIYSYVGVEPLLMRPPQGAMTAERVQASKYPIILWSVDSRDWVYKDRSSENIAAENIDIIVENVLSSVKDGDIILMHEIYENSYQAFSVIIDTLYREGYRFVTVSELLGESVQSGTKYHSLVIN